MRASGVRKHPVMATSTATKVGRVKDLVVDATGGRVVALRIAKSDAGEYVHWEDLSGVGPDAVVVPDLAVLGEARDRAAELLDKRFRLKGKRILSDRGDEVGTVEDVEFDQETGQLTSFITDDAPVAADRAVGLGGYALVVRAED